MQHIKEYTDKSENPVVLISSFRDNSCSRMLYMVDSLTDTGKSLIFDNKRNAIDYGQALTNRLLRA